MLFRYWEFLDENADSVSIRDWIQLVYFNLLTLSDILQNVCVFQAQLIAQSIGQAFHVAYMEFLKANGIDDPGLLKEMDYQDVLAQQEIHGEELDMFSNKENQKEVR